MQKKDLAVYYFSLVALFASSILQGQTAITRHVADSGGWHINDTKDVITNESKFDAQLFYGNFRVTATCGPAQLGMKIAYFAKPNPGYKLTNGMGGARVVARIAIDGRPTGLTSSVPEFSNEALFGFVRKAETEGGDVWKTIFQGISGASISDISPDEVYGAKLIKMEIPLANGELPILEMRPQDAEFQKFAARCKATFPAPNPTPVRGEDRRPKPTAMPKAPTAPANSQQDDIAAAITADRLPELLTTSLKGRAAELGVDPAQYVETIKTVGDIIRICSSIPRAEYENAWNNGGLLVYKGGLYKNCVRRMVFGIPIPDNKDGPGFFLSFNILNRDYVASYRINRTSKAPWDDPTIFVRVYLRPPPGGKNPASISDFERQNLLVSIDVKKQGF